MTKTNVKQASTQALVDVIVHGMQEIKAEQITSIDLREIPNSVADFFVICHGNSTTQVEAIAKSIEKEAFKGLKEKPWHVEGVQNSNWILLDFVNVVAHVFYKESREFYDLEGLWADAKITDYKE